MIVVLHRLRSEKLARRFAAAVAEQTLELPGLDQEILVRAFDALIQDGLIGQREPDPPDCRDW